MKVCGIIAEYNPFHLGHRYQLLEAKKRSEADYCIVIMSGCYVQRGEPAIFDPYIRTRMALLSGADLVLLLPAPFSSAAAGDFAGYSVRLLHALGVVDFLAFGSEDESAEKFEILEDALFSLSSDPAFYQQLREEMASGKTYPEAREIILGKMLSPRMDQPTLHRLLSSPNFLLGLEYRLAARKDGWRPEVIAVPRGKEGSHQSLLLREGSFASASALRKAIRENPGGYSRVISPYVPEEILSLFTETPPLFADDFSLLLNQKILGGNYADILDMGPELASRLKKTAFPPVSFTRRAESLKTRQVTYTRVSRALLHLLLDITAEEMTDFKSREALYGKILGFRQDALPLLSEIKKRASVPLLSKAANAPRLLPGPAFSLFKKDLAAAHLYETVKAEKGGEFCHELKRSPIII